MGSVIRFVCQRSGTRYPFFKNYPKPHLRSRRPRRSTPTPAETARGRWGGTITGLPPIGANKKLRTADVPPALPCGQDARGPLGNVSCRAGRPKAGGELTTNLRTAGVPPARGRTVNLIGARSATANLPIHPHAPPFGSVCRHGSTSSPFHSPTATPSRRGSAPPVRWPSPISMPFRPLVRSTTATV